MDEPVNDEALRAIDQRIAEQERKLHRLQRLASDIPTVEANITALRRARAIVSGAKFEDTSPARTHEIRLGESMKSPTDSTAIRAGSLGALAIEIVTEARAPMHVTEIARAINAKGREATLPTIVGAVARYARDGYLRRVGRSTYALGDKVPIDPVNMNPNGQEAAIGTG